MILLDSGTDYRRDFHLQDNELIIRTVQDDSEALALNRHLQSDGGVKSGDWQQPVLNIPLLKWVELTKQYPDLVHGSPEERKRRVAQIVREYPEYAIGAKSRYI